MGTSASSEGGKPSNPVIPSWSNPQPAVAESPDLNRYRAARHNFTTFIKSGGSDDIAFGRAISSYVGKTFGGAKQAAGRMSSECAVSVELGNILSSANKDGIQDVITQERVQVVITKKGIKGLELESLDTLPIPKIYETLVDVICPTGADRDDAMARDAYLDTIVDVDKLGLDLGKPSPETVATFMECYISNAIINRILNDIGMGFVTKSKNASEAQKIKKELKDSIHKSVRAAIKKNNKILQTDNMERTIKSLYKRSYTILEDLAEQKAKKK